MSLGACDVKEEILRYVQRHPRSAETLEGIARWWLTRQRFEEAIGAVQAALDELVRENKLERYIVAGGMPIYRARPGS